MTPQQAHAALGHLALVDVREADEWHAGHVAGSVHLPLHALPARSVELDRARPIAVICRSGNRSAHATAWLRGVGFDAENVEGGLQAWAAAGLPLTT